MNHDTKIIDLPPARYLNAHHWTNEEKVFKKKNRVLIEIEDFNIPLRSGLLYKLSKSVFGPFLNELNVKQFQDYMVNENKLQILQWQLRRYNDHDSRIVRERNSFLKDYYELLLKAVNDSGVIDLDFLKKRLKSICLDCCFVKQMDNSLQKFEQIKILTLCGNFIKDIPGVLLPRSLEFLELFDNFISDLSNLTRHAPRAISHLGLGRNRLTDSSGFHLLDESCNFTRLINIDLSDNDICSLKSALGGLENLSSLRALSLEGNPCSVKPEYKSYVIQHMPQLQYLDNTEILDCDKDSTIEKKSSQILFRCYRILGLPEPPKDKHSIQTIHLEVNFPLLVESSPDLEVIAPPVVENEVKKEDNSRSSDGKNKKGKDKAKNKKSEAKKGKKKSYYAGETEYVEDLEKMNVWFKSERMPWSKIIQFPPIEVNDHGKGLRAIRDVFRSIVPVRVVYLKIAQKSAARAAKPKKGQLNAVASPEQPEEKPVEVVLKKITLASFYCELKSLNWSDQMMDFYWADYPDVGDKALRIEGSLEALEYEFSPRKQTKSSTGNYGPKPENLPSVLTCQVGFGLSRC